MNDTESKAIWKALSDLQADINIMKIDLIRLSNKSQERHTRQIDENRKIDRALEELIKSFLRSTTS